MEGGEHRDDDDRRAPAGDDNRLGGNPENNEASPPPDPDSNSPPTPNVPSPDSLVVSSTTEEEQHQHGNPPGQEKMTSEATPPPSVDPYANVDSPDAQLVTSTSSVGVIVNPTVSSTRNPPVDDFAGMSLEEGGVRYHRILDNPVPGGPIGTTRQNTGASTSSRPPPTDPGASTSGWSPATNQRAASVRIPLVNITTAGQAPVTGSAASAGRALATNPNAYKPVRLPLESILRPAGRVAITSSAASAGRAPSTNPETKYVQVHIVGVVRSAGSSSVAASAGSSSRENPVPSASGRKRQANPYSSAIENPLLLDPMVSTLQPPPCIDPSASTSSTTQSHQVPVIVHTGTSSKVPPSKSTKRHSDPILQRERQPSSEASRTRPASLDRSDSGHYSLPPDDHKYYTKSLIEPSTKEISSNVKRTAKSLSADRGNSSSTDIVSPPKKPRMAPLIPTMKQNFPEAENKSEDDDDEAKNVDSKSKESPGNKRRKSNDDNE